MSGIRTLAKMDTAVRAVAPDDERKVEWDYPRLWTLTLAGNPRPINEMDEFGASLIAGSHNYSTGFSNPHTLFIQHDADDYINAVIDIAFLRPDNWVEECYACRQRPTEDQHAAMMLLTDFTQKTSALCYEHSIGMMQKV